MKTAAFAVGLAAVAVFFGVEPPSAVKWRSQSLLNVIWRSLGVDIRLKREYQHDFPSYGVYNFSSKSWPSIARVPLSSLSSQEFKDKYVKGRVPVILTDIEPQEAWGLKRLQGECGDMPVTFDRRYSAGLRAIPKWIRKLFLDPRLREAYNTTTDSVLAAMHRKMRLSDFLSFLKKDQDLISTAKQFLSENGKGSPLYSGHIVDYLFPVMLSAQHMERAHCKTLIAEAKAVLHRLTDFAAAGRDDAPEAIPLHQHGPYNDNLLWMLHGTKRIVAVSPSSTEWLYERPEFGGSEYADRVFSADVLEPDAGVQPDVAHVRAMEGHVSAGELIYLPVNVPHAVQTTEGDASVMLAWQMPVPGIARMFFMKSCSYLEELADFPPWAKKCTILHTLMQDNP
eukprot:g9475.t1